MADRTGPAEILVTGAGGTLGRRLTAHLITLPWVKTVYGLDIKPMTGAPFDSPKLRPIVADLADPRDERWIEAAEKAGGIVHFAVKNPLPAADWDETVVAIDMTANLIARSRTDCRFLFASSNHTMGQYKDADWSKVGKLSAVTPPRPGTRFFTKGKYYQPNLYGGSKLTTERLLRARAIALGGSFTAVSLRIGWCLSGDGHPRGINSEGGGTGAGGTEVQTAAEQARDLKWFRNMYLSPRDFCAEFEAALTADASAWPDPAVVVNAVSGNRGTLWDMDDAKRWLGHVPQDDVWALLGIDPD